MRAEFEPAARLDTKLWHCRFFQIHEMEPKTAGTGGREPGGGEVGWKVLLAPCLHCRAVAFGGGGGGRGGYRRGAPGQAAGGCAFRRRLAAGGERGGPRLGWLATQQADDGSFPTLPQAQPAVTSLCVLAFLSRGHQPGLGPYGGADGKGD